MVNNSANEWYISFLANRAVEIKRNIIPNFSSEGYALRIGRLYSNEIVEGNEYRISSFFYDSSTSQLFGRPCLTQWTRANQANQCEFFEEFFFHCPIIDEKIFVVLEFIERETEVAPVRSIGWTKKAIQMRNEPLLDLLNVPNELSMKTLEVSAGTPKILVFGGDEIQKVIGTVELELFSHARLLDIANYFPEFCIIGDRDDIPGIERLDNEPYLHIPKPEPQVSASLDELSLIFGPDASRIEKMILDEILYDWNLKDNTPQGSNKKTSIIERRLKIGVHNGFCYLAEPLSINLTPSNSNLLTNNSSLRKRRAMSSNDLRSGPASMFVNSRVSIANICEDPRVALIFLVEYTFLHEDERKFSQPVLIGWGAWKPFGEDSEAGNRHHIQATVSLVGGPRPNPEGLLCFRNLLHLRRSDDSVFTESQPQISINFSFFLDQLRMESRASTHPGDRLPLSTRLTPKTDRSNKKQFSRAEDEQTIQPASPRNDQQLKDFNDNESKPSQFPKIDTARSVSSQEELQAINEGINRIIDQESVKSQQNIPNYETDEDADQISASTYSIPFKDSKPSNFPRSIHSLFAHHNFYHLKDRNGESPVTEDANQKFITDIVREKNDRLDTSHIFFQFVAFKQLASSDVVPTISKIFFTTSFYRFPELVTESLLLKTAEKGEPAILTRVDKNGQQNEEMINNPGYIAKYVIDGDEEKNDFIEFLSTGHVVIDVWNSDSLIHIGSAIIPLKNILRRGRDAVQLFLQCPIIESNSGINSADSKSVNFILYLRLANIGHPAANIYADSAGNPTNVSTVSRRLTSATKLSEEGPHTYRVHAKPLNTANKSGLDRFLTAQRLDIQQRHEEIFNEESFDKIKQWNQLKKNFNFESNKKITQKFIFEEELAAYKKLRFESKPAKLLEAVFKGITICHEIRPSFGEKLFFEFPLENVISQPINCVIEFEDEALRPVSDYEEWSFYKTMNKLKTPIEKNMIRETNDRIEIHLKPGETIFVPFVYDSFFFPNNHFDMYSTKVVFRRWDTQEPLSILDLHVYRRNQCTNHSITFIAEATQSCQKQIILPPMPKDRRVLSSRCSDPAVKTTIRSSSLQQVLGFTTYSDETGRRKTFYLFMYSDHYYSRLISTWKITILPFSRIDVRGVVGQTTRSNISITRNSEHDAPDDLLKVFSNSACLSFETSILADRQPNVAIDYTPNFIGRRRFVTSVVNSNTGKLEAGFLVFASSEAPKITQSFVVNVAIEDDGTVTKKKLSIRNPYGLPRTFRISTSRSDIVKVSDTVLNIPAMGSKMCEIFIAKISHKPINIETLLYISNADNNMQEEVYSILVKFY